MTDLLSRLTEYAEGNMTPFHMPGHKRDPGLFLAADTAFPKELLPLYGIDITEIDGFDDLHDPRGILKDAEERAARAYGSSHTHYLVNGSTAGILSAVSAAAFRAGLPGMTGSSPEGGFSRRALLIARNCHKSVYHAAFLNRLELRYLYPVFDEEFGIFGEIRPSDVRDALLSAREEGLCVVGVVVTSPTYEGIVSDIAKIAGEAHAFGVPLITDEAHGAHFGFYHAEGASGEESCGIGENAARLGADLSIDSVHKTLPAPTQTALIHVNGDLVSDDTVRKYLRIYQTSSPSYPLMAGIDAAVSLMASEGGELLRNMIRMRREFQSGIEDLNCVRLCPYTEPGKLLLSVKGARRNGDPYTGKDLMDDLRKSHGIELEMACGTYALGILTVADSRESLQKLAKGLRKINESLRPGKIEPWAVETGEPHPEAAVPFYEAYGMETEEVLLKEAEGRIAAELTGIYPPGVPVLVPGEIWTEDAVRRIEKDVRTGFHTEGVRNGAVRVLKGAQGQKRFI